MNSTKSNPILQYCQKMNMSYSYKPVLILALLNNNGKISTHDAANYFASFYSSRLERGLIAEKSNSIYSNLNCTFEQIRQNIINNPIKALTSSSALFKYDAQRDLLTIDNYILTKLTPQELQRVITACEDRLERYFANLNNSSIVLFQDETQVNGYLSNRFYSEFYIMGQQFCSMTQYMTYRKALILGNECRGRYIMSISDPNTLEDIFRQMDNQGNILWQGQRQVVAYQGLIAKFLQNEEMARWLLDTGSSAIGACLPADSVWGIGLTLQDERAKNLNSWSGQNMLGFTLMQVRNAICNTRSL